MVATLVFDEDQRADKVKFSVVLSVKVPVATNCLVRFFTMDILDGVIVINFNTAFVCSHAKLLHL